MCPTAKLADNPLDNGNKLQCFFTVLLNVSSLHHGQICEPAIALPQPSSIKVQMDSSSTITKFEKSQITHFSYSSDSKEHCAPKCLHSPASPWTDMWTCHSVASPLSNWGTNGFIFYNYQIWEKSDNYIFSILLTRSIASIKWMMLAGSFQFWQVS
jgi:hypothetical protein